MTNIVEDYIPAKTASALCQRSFGISRPTFYRWISEGRFNMGADSVVRLAGRLHIRRDALNRPVTDGLVRRHASKLMEKRAEARRDRRCILIENRCGVPTLSIRVRTRKGNAVTLAQWAKQSGINYRTLYARLRHGWNVKQALTQPVRRQRA